MLVAEEHGGGSVSGNGVADLALIAEEIGRRVAPGPLLAVNVVAAALSRFGTEDQRAAWLDSLVAGEALATWGIGRSSGPGSTTTLRAQRVDGSIVLDGHLAPIEAIDVAGLLLVSVDVDGAGCNVLVSLDTPGMTVEPLVSLDLVKRFGRVRFSNVTLPPGAVLPGDGDEQFEALLDIAAVLQAAEISGLVDHWLGQTIEYAFDRYSFGRPLASYQALKHRFANAKTYAEASLASSTAAAAAVGTGAPRASELASVAKVYAGELGTTALHEFVQLNGGIATTWDHDLHLSLRRASQDRSLYGTPAEHRERLAQILGMGT